jgi:hypothetical protein
MYANLQEIETPVLYSAPVYFLQQTSGGGGEVESSFPKCQRCKTGDLVPLSDFGSQGAAIHYKAWACTNPECGYNIKIRNGDIYMDEPIASGMMHAQRMR